MRKTSKMLEGTASVDYDVLQSGAAGIVAVMNKYLDKHPELKALPEWQSRRQKGLDLQREIRERYDDFVLAADPADAMKPYFDRIDALRIEGENY